MNKPLLRKVRDTIRQRPGQFIMDAYFSCETQACKTPFHCGTACCIAGWTIALASQLKPADLFEKQWSFDEDVFDQATRFLTLTDAAASRLFYTDDWPKLFRDEWVQAEGKQASDKTFANIAVRRINHFLNTGK